jgi:hypothetical protein
MDAGKKVDCKKKESGKMLPFWGSVARLSLPDQNTSDDIRKGLGVYGMDEKIQDYRNNLRCHLDRMKVGRLQKKSFKYIPREENHRKI